LGDDFSVAWVAQAALKNASKLVIGQKVAKKRENRLRETTSEGLCRPHDQTRVQLLWRSLLGRVFLMAWAAQTAAKDAPKLVIAHKVVKKTRNWLRETTYGCLLPVA
jgi:hypothetical protein